MTTHKVLIVDDDPAQQDDVAEMLLFSSKASYEPLKAASGQEALARYRSNPDIALVIFDTDLNPTNEKGWQVYDLLRGEGYTGPALARSARERSPEWDTRSVPFLEKSAPSTELENRVYALLQ